MPAADRRFEDRVVLITGTGSGMGREAARRFAAEGATVVGCDLDADGHAQTVALVREAGGAMSGTAPLDLGDPDAAAGWVAAALDEHGRIDVVFNNASAARFGGIEEISVEDWRFTMRNELDLVFYVSKFAWPHLKASRGVIVNTGSIAGLVGTRYLGQTPHVATKGGVVALTRQLAAEGAEHGIRAVCISPGGIETPPTAAMYADETMRAGILGGQLVDRPGQPGDVIALALFVASDDAAFVTGANFVVDGGVTAI
jgi:NAD(P)-dependent dehydrogenase (short-subunit alcohol dehydrogenase family)